MTPARLQTEPSFVLEGDGVVTGFGGLRVDGAHAELATLLVEPDAIRRGHGRRLWRYAVELAGSPGAAIPGRLVPLLVDPLPDMADPPPSAG